MNVSSLKCYQCTNFVASNDNLGSLQSNEACAGATFDPNGVVLQDCGTVFGQTPMCEKWEGKFTVNVPFLGNTAVTGQVRGCAFVPVGELVDGCASSTQLTGLAKDAVRLIVSFFTTGEVEGTYCSCERDYCNTAPALSQTAPLLVMIGLLFSQVFVL
ncbi:uncharacterized protein LOC110982956 isoform X2 [Acanthaster planci]|uniref:Uncharacterized protein LOC110982956 isoform X2 n=1 Tax=Acanthaster planci TaxID=133434 RepID=A0A8B7Z252_ACAPL|nr:uncharacterized protein LOC110982956 isoform X2 [Acanthaster planci]